jgi:hypothetical protein
MKSRSFAFMLLMSTALTGCATFKPPLISYDDEQPAVLQADPEGEKLGATFDEGADPVESRRV